MTDYETITRAGLFQDQCDSLPDILLSWWDYGVVGSMLAIIGFIGLYYMVKGRNNESSSSDFLMGGGNVSTWNMSVSLGSGYITAIELLGNPVEMYLNGVQYLMICVAVSLVVPIASYLFLPVFFRLRMTSCFEYLERRFSGTIRRMVSGAFNVQMLTYSAMAVYAPSLSLSSVTKIKLIYIILAVYGFCIFYTATGGLKAVIITDALQTLVLIVSLIVVLAYGMYDVRQPKEVFSYLQKTDRLEFFDMNTDLTKRHTFWTVVIGGWFYWVSMFSVNQASIQKCLSVKDISQARKGLWTAAIFMIFVHIINFATGAIIVYKYKGCDLIMSGVIPTSDQLVPYYVQNVMGHIPGITGLYTAGILAASLGTVASAISSVAAAFSEDFKGGKFWSKSIKPMSAKGVKIISVFVGIISLSLIYPLSMLGSVLEVAITFNGLPGGIILGVFTLGMFFPRANAKGTFIGILMATTTLLVIGIGSLTYSFNGKRENSKFLSIENCTCINTTEKLQIIDQPEDIHPIFSISYLWYTLIGFTITVVIGNVASYFFEKPTVSRDLLSPPVAAFLDMKFKGTININDEGNHKGGNIKLEKITNASNQISGKFKKIILFPSEIQCE